MEETKQIIFNIGEEEYGVGIDDVKGIERQMQIVKVPNRPPYILGIVNLRGDIIPVYSLKVKFGGEETIEEESKLIITNASGLTIALKVDEVKEITEVPVENIFELPMLASNEHTDYVKNIAKIDKRIVILLDVNGVLGEEERERIAEMLQEID